MNIEKVWALSFSPTGNTRRAVRSLAQRLSKQLELPFEDLSLTSPASRSKNYSFDTCDLVILGSPTHAGRLPNKIAPVLKEALHGNNTPAVGLVTFGNRAFDNSLAEMGALLTNTGFIPLAAGAFVAPHPFSDHLGSDHPNYDDRELMEHLACEIRSALTSQSFSLPTPHDALYALHIPGAADAPYYRPLGKDGEPVNFLKAKPKTKMTCTNCGACARRCPMGAIDPENVFSVPGTCIKCQECVKVCTAHAKYFDDESFLSHVTMLEKNYDRPIASQIFTITSTA